MPQLSLVVALVRWTVMCAPEARVTVPHLCFRYAAATHIYTLSLHDALPISASMDQLTPLPPGSGSESVVPVESPGPAFVDRKSTRLNSSHMSNSYAVFCVKKRLGQLTVSEACLVSVPSLPETKVAELL